MTWDTVYKYNDLDNVQHTAKIGQDAYLLQQTMRSMLFCVTQNNNNSLGNTHVDHILLDQLGFHS